MSPRRTYLRFVTATIDEHSHKRRGVFQAVGDLVRANDLPPYDHDELLDLRQWFNENLNPPNRFSRSRRPGAAPKAICWFKSNAKTHMRQIRLVCRVLIEHGVHTEMIKSYRPGYIVFEDSQQIAAIPFAETTT